MTIQELIKSGNKNEIEKIAKQMDEMHHKDLIQKIFVIKVYLICNTIAIGAIVLMIIELFKD